MVYQFYILSIFYLAKILLMAQHRAQDKQNNSNKIQLSI